jgi:hypothetical protein
MAQTRSRPEPVVKPSSLFRGDQSSWAGWSVCRKSAFVSRRNETHEAGTYANSACADIICQATIRSRDPEAPNVMWKQRAITMNPMRQSALIVVLAVSLMLPMPAINAQGQTVETGMVKLADSNIEYFSRGEGEPIVLLPGGTLTVGYLDGLADALAKAGY